MNRESEIELDNILREFSTYVSRLFKVAYAVLPGNVDVDHAYNIFKIVRNDSPFIMIERSVDKLWDNQIQITNRDEDYFKVMRVDKYFDENDTADDREFLERLITTLRLKYEYLSIEEKDYLWNCIQNLLKCVIKYKIIKQEHL